MTTMTPAQSDKCVAVTGTKVAFSPNGLCPTTRVGDARKGPADERHECATAAAESPTRKPACGNSAKAPRVQHPTSTWTWKHTHTPRTLTLTNPPHYTGRMKHTPSTHTDTHTSRAGRGRTPPPPKQERSARPCVQPSAHRA